MATASIEFFPVNSLQFLKPGKAVVGISLNNFVCRSPLLLGQLFSWTASHFEGFDVLVGDYLTRHNYEAFSKLPEPAAIKKAMHYGKRTIEAISVPLATSSPEAKILSAQALYENLTFSERLSRFQREYESSGTFRHLIDQAIHEFLSRRRYRGDSATVRQHCVAYQLEELVIFELLAEKGYTSLVYAGAQLPVMKGIVSNRLSGLSKALEGLSLVEMRFAKEI